VSCIPSGARTRTLRRHDRPADALSARGDECVRRLDRIVHFERESHVAGSRLSDLDAVDAFRLLDGQQFQRRATGLEDHAAAALDLPRLEDLEAEPVAIERERLLVVRDGEDDLQRSRRRGHCASGIDAMPSISTSWSG